MADAFPRLQTGAQSAGQWPTWSGWAIGALLVWLPLSTPVALLAFQYAHFGVPAARAILLSKDALAGILVLVLFARFRSRLIWMRADAFAIAFAGVVVLYSVIPLAVGSGMSLGAVAASARQLLFPVEFYMIGRLAGTVGIPGHLLAIVFVVTASVVAATASVLYLFVPVEFLATTYNLVAFIRDVQGFPTAENLWNVSIIGQYTGTSSLEFARAVGTFTHPVGLAHYLVLPIVLALGAAFTRTGLRTIVFAAAAGLCTFALVATISRGTWLAGALAIAVTAVAYRRLWQGAAIVAVASLLIIAVPAFRLSVTSLVSGTDPSTAGHIYAVEKNVNTILENPLGAGVGRADKFGSVDLGGASVGPTAPQEDVGVGENLYLSMFVSAGPLSILAFLGWIIGTLVILIRSTAEWRRDWLAVGVIAATAGYLLSGMTSSPLFRLSSSGSYWLFLGLAVTAALMTGQGEVWRKREAATSLEIATRSSDA